MGGGYYPRFLALDLHLRGTLPDDYDSTAFHLNPEMRPAIDREARGRDAEPIQEPDRGDGEEPSYLSVGADHT